LSQRGFWRLFRTTQSSINRGGASHEAHDEGDFGRGDCPYADVVSLGRYCLTTDAADDAVDSDHRALGDAPGRVLVQTFQPESRAVALAARQDVEGFLAGELERRRELGYPPYRHLVRILVSGPEREDAMRALREVADGLADAPGELLGPAALFRLRGRHRAQLVAKTESPREVASRAARLLASAARAMRDADLTAVVDVDPQSL
jgi:primosomal protein N'